MSTGGYQAEYASDVKQEVSEVKPKKRNFIDRWFEKKSKEAWDNVLLESRRGPAGPPGPKSLSTNEFDFTLDGVNIRVYGATGGQIVEFRKYDKHGDRNNTKLYVIPTEQNFVESFSKIVSMEMIR